MLTAFQSWRTPPKKNPTMHSDRHRTQFVLPGTQCGSEWLPTRPWCLLKCLRPTNESTQESYDDFNEILLEKTTKPAFVRDLLTVKTAFYGCFVFVSVTAHWNMSWRLGQRSRFWNDKNFAEGGIKSTERGWGRKNRNEPFLWLPTS